LNLEEGYADKYEEINNFRPKDPKTLKGIFLGPTIGFIMNINDRLRVEIGIEYVYELAPLFKRDEPFYIIGYLPIKLGYKL